MANNLGGAFARAVGSSGLTGARYQPGKGLVGYKPPGTPTVQPQPSAQTQPFDAGYDTTVSALDKQRANTLANLTYQEGQLGQTYGLTQDPVTGAISEDPTNPFAQAALLKRAYQQHQQGTTNSYAARGQLYSGALENAQGENAYQYAKGYDENTRTFQDAVQRIVAGQTGAQDTYGLGVGQAASNALDRAVANRPDPLTLPPAPSSTTPAARPATKPKRSPANSYGGAWGWRGPRG